MRAASASQTPHWACCMYEVIAMTGAAVSTRHGAVSIASREVLTWAGPVAVGDVLGIVSGDVALIGDDLDLHEVGLERLPAEPGGEHLVGLVDGVVDVAQRGRSLGLHLVLATQRPAGVIKDNLRANTNLRIALRMADEADSKDILGDKMAAHFDPGIPGRAAAKTGPGRIATFQTGYAGGWTTDPQGPPTAPRAPAGRL